jgi:hypothetical protein
MHPHARDDTARGWILIHSESKYDGTGPYRTPQDQLDKEFQPGKRWHWNLNPPMKDDGRPHRLLLAWDQSVFGEATARISQKVDRGAKKEYSFVFVLSAYKALQKPIPFGRLRLGSREHYHRSLIRLDDQVLAAYRAANGGATCLDLSPEVEEAESAGKSAANGQRQGIHLNPEERRCVELRGMAVAEKWLKNRGYVATNVSKGQPHDFSATKGGRSFAVEVKGTTGDGSAIILTKNEVAVQRKRYPANMLIVVHSIRLDRMGKKPKAGGGTVVVRSPWPIEGGRLTPLTYAYRV